VRDMTATGPMDTSLEVAKNLERGVIGYKNDMWLGDTYAIKCYTDERRIKTILWGKSSDLTDIE
jgi:hypothetical protein